jgi:hypothetical protein
MKTVTIGRDSTNQPIWHPTFRQAAAEFGFHPEACAVGQANQKGTVESLVKWVKGNFLAGRRFADHPDLAQQAAEWVGMANSRTSEATGVPPVERVREEASQGGKLPLTAQDYGFPRSARVTAESVIHLRRNVYSVPVANVGTTVTARLCRDEVRIFHNTDEIARHRRAPDGSWRRVIDPEHFRPLFTKKPRAQLMLYRQANVRHALYMAATSACRAERPVKSFYLRLLQQGKPQKVAIVAGPHKLLRMANAVVRKRQAWDPNWRNVSRSTQASDTFLCLCEGGQWPSERPVDPELAEDTIKECCKTLRHPTIAAQVSDWPRKLRTITERVRWMSRRAARCRVGRAEVQRGRAANQRVPVCSGIRHLRSSTSRRVRASQPLASKNWLKAPTSSGQTPGIHIRAHYCNRPEDVGAKRTIITTAQSTLFASLTAYRLLRDASDYQHLAANDTSSM